ncbi:conserved hypothetical protein [Carnobacterium maltaromaticum LMA28]|uniref:DUF2213 domain-containing protein n=1 Tax=Carnobacterium maltaromaticum LMA28 TaxID=1234679 RepID=K8EHH3_CARML|nr:DUF2213 domain-containing protein [Carnobacterium maltaromaticum]CCO11293.2 conserved hypothetical protein [Carnobacterium maltaromaticum LMA28]
MGRVNLYDKALIEDFSETDEGYLTVKAPITRPGVFPYLTKDGAVEMQAKLPEELFSDKTIKSANAKPVTDDHPHEAVTAKNFTKYSKGMTHTDARVENNTLVVSFTVTDSATIQKIKAGKRELSIGFSADVKDEKGNYSGMNYDSVQRNMQVNHLAIVDKGRAGPEVAILNDSVDFVMDSKKNKQNGGNKMPQIIIDGSEFEVDTAVKSKFDALSAQADAAETKAKGLDALQGERDALKEKLDAKEAEITELKKNQVNEDEMDSRIQARIELVEKAKPILGDSFEFTGKSDRVVKEAAILETKKDFKADGKSDDYIDAFFDSMTELVADKGFTHGVNFSDAKDKEKAADEEINQKKQNRLNMNKKGEK